MWDLKSEVTANPCCFKYINDDPYRNHLLKVRDMISVGLHVIFHNGAVSKYCGYFFFLFFERIPFFLVDNLVISVLCPRATNNVANFLRNSSRSSSDKSSIIPITCFTRFILATIFANSSFSNKPDNLLYRRLENLVDPVIVDKSRDTSVGPFMVLCLDWRKG